MALTTTNLSITTPLQLVNSLLGVGITANNITFTGANVAGGSFIGGLSEDIGIDTGVILSSGNIANAAGPNNSDSAGTNNGTGGDAALNAIVSATTFDASILQFDFVPTQSTLSFRYVFASEEYNEFVPAVFNDVFAFFLNGTNIALIPGTSSPVSIKTVNTGTNSNRFKNNDFGDLGPTTPFGTQFDGFTTVLRARAAVTPGVNNTIRLAIADTADSILDSAVFIQAGSFTSGDPDLIVSKTDSPDPVKLGDTVTYTITVSNIGTLEETDVEVRDTLPASFTNIIPTVVSGGFTSSVTGNVVNFTGGSLAAGASATLTIAAKAISSVPTVTNTVVVDPDDISFESNENNNTFSETTTVSAPDLAIAKTDSPDPVAAGSTLTYNLKVSNIGTADATGVVVQDTLPVSLTNITATGGSGFTVNQAGNVVTFSGGTIAAGGSADFVITGIPSSAVNSLVNNAVVDPNNAIVEFNETNNSILIDTTVTGINPSPSPSPTPGSPSPSPSPSPTPIVNPFPSFSNTFITGTDAGELFNLTDVGDAIAAGGGDDTVFGFNGNDLEFGNQGNDQLNGNQGNDTLYGGQDNDIVSGGKDSDFVYGDRGDDIVNGNNGNDIVYGGKGNDTVYGGQNEDSVSGDLGNDYVSGDLGDDVLTGVSASSLAPGLGEIDTLIGGAGRDVFVLGDSIIPYYDDTNTSLPGTSDYAEIRDFTPGTDRIQLKTGPSYFLGSSPVGLPSGAGLFINQGGGSELIAILIGIAPGSLDLGSSNFTYVGVV